MSRQEDNEIEAKFKNEVIGDFKDGVDCSKCLNRGYIYFVENDCVVGYECDCMKERRANNYLRTSGLRSIAALYTFENFKVETEWQKLMLSTALDWLENGGDKWFYAGGQVGSGKSHICTAIAVERMKRGTKTRYMIWRDFVATMQAHKFDEDEDRLIDSWRTVPLLYIDDFYKCDGKPSADEIGLAHRILNDRYMSGLPTIISSEWTLDRMYEFDQANMSRISQRCNGYEIAIGVDNDKNIRLQLGGN